MKKPFLLFLFLSIALCLPAQSYTFVSYNIRYDNPGDGADAWPIRRDFLAGQLRFHAPDVFGVQEGLKHQLDYLKEQLPRYAYSGVGRDDGREAGEYTAIFYGKDRFRALKSGTFWLSERPDTVSTGWDAAMPRICSWVLLEDTTCGKKMWAFNAHFDHIGEVARQQSAALIIQKIAALNTAGYPVVLLGDFNSMPEAKPIAVLSQNLLDSHDHTQEAPFGPEGTFNGFKLQKPVTRRIDYVFVSGNWTVQQYAVLSDSRNGHYPSDHLPVLVRLEIKD